MLIYLLTAVVLPPGGSSAIHIYTQTIHISYRSISTHITKLATVQFSHLQNDFQNNGPLHCPRETLTISLHFTFYLFINFLNYPINPSLHFTLLFISTTHFPSFHFTSLPFTFDFLSPWLPLTGFHFPNPRFENMRFTVSLKFNNSQHSLFMSISNSYFSVNNDTETNCQ
jgi:hypothetical protein